MEHHRLDDMTGGWFIGAFAPAAFSTPDCEVAVKRYTAGTYEAEHVHRVATEITLVLSGRVQMRGREWSDGDIIVLAPGESTDFTAITNAVNVVVKVPGALDDKYLIGA